jgi:O-antigen/teichoic acid export membrane protein
LSLRINFTWTFFGNLIYAACSWAMLIALAKFGTTEDVGQFALGLAVTAPIILFANLQLRNLQATDSRREYLFRDYLGLRLIMLFVALVVIVAVALLSGYQYETALTIIIIGIGKAIDSLSDVIYGLLQQNEQMKRISVSTTLKGIFSLVMLIAGKILTGSILGAALGWAIASVIVFCFYDIRSAMLIQVAEKLLNSKSAAQQDSLIPRFKRASLRKLIWLTLPLGLTAMLLSLHGNIPRYYISHYLGEDALGIFASIAFLVTVGDLTLNAMGQVISPRLAKYYTSQNRAAYEKLFLRFLGLGLLMGTLGIIAVLVFGRQILTLIYGSEYAESTNVLFWIAIETSISFVASSLGYALTSARILNVQPIIVLVGVGATVLLCIVLIPAYGLLGAAWATLGAIIVQTILLLLAGTAIVRRLKEPILSTVS